MTTRIVRDRPWEPDRARMALRGHVIVRLRHDDQQADLPAHVDVAAGIAEPARESGWHRIDRAINRHSSSMQFSKAYHACASVGLRAQHHIGYSALEHELGLSRTFRLTVDPDANVLNLVDDLRALDGVEMVTPVYLCHLPVGAGKGAAWGAGSTYGGAGAPDPLYAHRMIHAAEAHALVPGDPALIIGIVDSGVALEHPELTGRLRTGGSTCHLVDDGAPRSLKLVPGATERLPRDHMGHGTSCAGIIGARGLEIPGGLAGASMVLPIRALAASHVPGSTALSAVGRSDDIDLGVKLGIDLGARVLNLSFGTPASALREDDEVPHVDVVRYALARDCILVAASGNGGDDVPYYPAALPGVIAVGSVGPSRRPSRFTSRGLHVALSAPGEAIPSAGLKGYDRVTGTSFAAPFVAAACALLVARASTAGVPVTAFNVRNALVDGAAPFAPGSDTTGCGGGILDVTGALTALDSLLNDSADQEAEPPATLGSGQRPRSTKTPKKSTPWAEPRMEGG